MYEERGCAKGECEGQENRGECARTSACGESPQKDRRAFACENRPPNH